MLTKKIKNVYLDRINKEISVTEYVNEDEEKISFQNLWRYHVTTNQEFINSIHNNSERLRKIDKEILDLFQERCDIITSNYMSLRSALKTLRVFDGKAYYEIHNKFNESKFEDESVRNFVKNVREMCFDDSKEEFQKFNCINISQSWKHELVTWFSNGKVNFGVCIPFAVDTEKMYEHGLYSGNFYIEMYTSEYSSICGCSTLDLDKFREYIWDIVRLDDINDISVYINNMSDPRLYYHDINRSIDDIISYNDKHMSYLRL